MSFFTARVLWCLLILSGVAWSETAVYPGSNRSPGKEFILVKENSPRAVIVLPENASDRERFAAEELQEYVEKISGVKILIWKETKALTENQIHIGNTRFAKEHIDFVTLPPEGFHIKTCGANLLLAGKDDAGTLFAVYTFLETCLGVRWFWPGELGEAVPRQKTITIGAVEDRQSPDFILRRISPGLSRPTRHPGPQKKIGTRILDDNELWRLRNKLGGSVDYGGYTHDFGHIIPPDTYGPVHPEYFALVNGQRDWKNFNGKHGCQLCTTNPDVIRLVIAYVRNYFDQHPEMAAVSINPNDGGGFCECPNCRALDVVAETAQVGAEVTEDDSRRRMDDKGKPILTDRIFTFANEVARAIQQTHPGKSVLMLAYAQYVEPPLKVMPEKNIWVQLCLNSDFLCDSDFYAKRMGQFDRWIQMTDNLLLYDYFSWRGGPDLPRNTSGLIQDAIRHYRKAGVNKFFTQSRDNFGAEGLDYYVAAKLLWNTKLDADAILDDYCQTCFGLAAAPMREWFTLLDHRWRDAVEQLGTDKYAGSSAYSLEMFPPEVRKRAGDLFAQAKGAADADSLRRLEFFETGFHYTERTLDYLLCLERMDKAGLIHISTKYTRISEVKPPEKVKVTAAEAQALLRNTLNAWQKREEFVEQIKDEHIIDYWHIRNNVDKDYKFNPVQKLEEILQRYSGNP